jgi:hypothetical protein
VNRGTTQKIVIVIVVAIIAAGLAFFIYRTYFAYLSGPSITVTEPANYAAFSTSTTTIVGIAKRVQDITLDGRSIIIDDKGNFSETILLMPGYNIETISAHDQFGHTTEKRLELVYLAPKTMASTSMATST